MVDEEKIRVLVVDDNEDILTLFTELLRLKKFEVVGEAQNGKDAVKMYECHRPDIVFLDVVMPDGDGIYALEKIRVLDPNAIVVMVTSDLAATTSERMKQLHASAVVYKPFDFNDIIEVVKQLLSKTNVNQLKFFN